MRIRKLIPLLGFIPFILLSGACGELDTVFPSSGTYRVDALISEFSLGTCAVVGEQNDIRPYFVNSVTNDPDVRGLTVFLQSPGGGILGGKLSYVLNTGEGEHLEKEPPVVEQLPVTEQKESSPKPDESQSFAAGTEPEEGLSEPGTDTVEEQPAGDRAVTPPPQPDRLRIGTADRQIPVSRLDVDLPPFFLPEGMEPGRYVMVFQVQGERDVLYRIDKPFYYTGNAEFAIEEIHSYLPGLFPGSPLIPPGTTVMLEARVSADTRLDPYVVWYNGRRRIGEGRLQDGANRLMWKAPDQTGFHHVRVELFPFRPLENAGGKVKELSLPVSSKHGEIGYFSEAGETFIHWYQFGGDLRDSRGGTDKALSPQGDTRPRWLPEGGIYGIALGAEDVYLLPGSPFTLAEGERGNGRFLLRFKPLGEGTILKASFKTGNSSRDVLDLSLSWTGEALKLALASNGESHTALLGAESFNREEFVAAALSFSIQGTVFSAALGLENAGPGTEEKTLTFPAALSGTGTVQLGLPRPKRAVPSQETAPGNEASLRKDPASVMPVAILDEIVLVYTVEAFSGEEVLEPPVQEDVETLETVSLPEEGENSGPV